MLFYLYVMFLSQYQRNGNHNHESKLKFSECLNLCSWNLVPYFRFMLTGTSTGATRNVRVRCWVASRSILCPRSVARDKRATETRAWGSTALLLRVRGLEEWTPFSVQPGSLYCTPRGGTQHRGEMGYPDNGNTQAPLQDPSAHQTMREARESLRLFVLVWIHPLAESLQPSPAICLVGCIGAARVRKVPSCFIGHCGLLWKLWLHWFGVFCVGVWGLTQILYFEWMWPLRELSLLV